MIRCKDCKWWEKKGDIIGLRWSNGNPIGEGPCHRYPHERPMKTEYDYCGEAEAKEK